MRNASGQSKHDECLCMVSTAEIEMRKVSAKKFQGAGARDLQLIMAMVVCLSCLPFTCFQTAV